MATQTDPTEKQLQAHIACLTIIQSIIARMAGYSSNLKNFALTSAVAIVIFGLDKRTPEMWYAALAAVALFMFLDAYYLAQERAFRGIYNAVSRQEWSEAFRFEIVHPGVSFLQVVDALRSASVWLFYVPMLVGIILLIWSGLHVPTNPAC